LKANTSHRYGLIAISSLLMLGLAPMARGGGVVQGCTEPALRAALASGGTVAFSNDCTITLSQQITINQTTTIDAQGHKVVISGGGAVRLFNVAANLTLRGLSLVNGKSVSSGGAVFVQPGVVFIANRCMFGGNSVAPTNGLAGTIGGTNSAGTGRDGSPGFDGPRALGGAIYNQGDAALINCTLTNNTAIAGAGGSGGPGGNGSGTFALAGNGGDGGAGGAALGGAVYNIANLTVVDCTFSSNSVIGGNGGAGGAGGSGSFTGMPGNGGSGGVGSGGALYNALNLTLTTSTFATNSARGGNSAAAGMLGNGTGISGRKGANGSGGALFNAWWAAATNCTFYTNSVFGGVGGNGGNGGGTFQVPGDGGDGGDALGGAVANENTLTMVTCTLSSGAAFAGTNGTAGSGVFASANGQPGAARGGNLENSNALILQGTILTAGVSGNNIFGDLTDAGYNLSSDSVNSFGGSSLQNTDPRLRPLAFNGGPTRTMALLAGSPAIDRIPPELTPPTDQRGFPRPANGAGDIGSFELGAAAPASNVSLSMTRLTNGLVQLSGQGTAGIDYVVQASTNLIDWQTIATNLAPIQFTDPVTNLSTRFYRLTR
jgi:hypothetical protein